MKNLITKIFVIFLISSNLFLSCKKANELPTVTTNEITNIEHSTATCSGTIINEGDSEVITRGACWSTSENPTLSDNILQAINETNFFIINLTELTANTKYYIKTYATNEFGTSYGEQKEFTTINSPQSPTVSTIDISNSDYNFITCRGNILDNGGRDITSCGICWSSNENPTISDNKTELDSTIGVFSSEISGLEEGTYYFRAYATNNIGTSYGEQLQLIYTKNFFKDFEDEDIYSGGWITKILEGTANWEISYYGNYIRISNINLIGGHFTSKVWYISPSIKTNASSYLSFINSYGDPGDILEVKYSTNYDGASAPNTATWIGLSPELSNGDWEWEESGELSLPESSNLYVSFIYTGTDTDGSTWGIDDIFVKIK